jgi:hypothetical protein
MWILYLPVPWQGTPRPLLPVTWSSFSFRCRVPKTDPDTPYKKINVQPLANTIYQSTITNPIRTSHDQVVNMELACDQTIARLHAYRPPASHRPNRYTRASRRIQLRSQEETQRRSARNTIIDIDLCVYTVYILTGRLCSRRAWEWGNCRTVPDLGPHSPFLIDSQAAKW